MDRAVLEYLLKAGYDTTAKKFAEEVSAKDPRMKRRASLRARTPRARSRAPGDTSLMQPRARAAEHLPDTHKAHALSAWMRRRATASGLLRARFAR